MTAPSVIETGRGSLRKMAEADVVIVDGEVVKSRWTTLEAMNALLADGLIEVQDGHLVLTDLGLGTLIRLRYNQTVGAGGSVS